MGIVWDGKKAVIGGSVFIKTLDVESLQTNSELSISHKEEITLLAFENNVLATCDVQNQIKIWNYKSKKCLHTLEKSQATITDIALSNNQLFYSDESGNIHIVGPLVSEEEDADNLNDEILDMLKEDEEMLNLSELENDDGELKPTEEIEEGKINLI